MVSLQVASDDELSGEEVPCSSEVSLNYEKNIAGA